MLKDVVQGFLLLLLLSASVFALGFILPECTNVPIVSNAISGIAVIIEYIRPLNKFIWLQHCLNGIISLFGLVLIVQYIHFYKWVLKKISDFKKS